MRYFIIFILLCLVSFASNFAYVHLGLYDSDIKKCNAELVYRLDSIRSKNKILYLGESSNFTASDADSSKKSISEIIKTFNSEYNIVDITKGAIHGETYKVLIERIKKTDSVKTIIVTLNLRSFGINWIESDLETNLSRSNIIYSNHYPIIKKFLLSFKAYDNQELFKRKIEIKSHYRNDKFKLKKQKYESVYEWDKDVYHNGIKDNNGVKDQEKTNIACHFIKNHAFIVDEYNPRIKDYDAIVKYCKEKNIKLIIHLLPENYERAEELCGTDLSDLIKTNSEYLKNRYQKNLIFIDNSFSLNDSFFIDRQWPTEHYIFKGRYFIAKSISDQLNTTVE